MHEMLNQPWGVEVEMYHISRSRAARVLAASLSRQTGVPWWANYRGGTYDAYDVRKDGDPPHRVWLLERDASIIASEDCKTELVTPILSWDEMPLLQQALRDLRKAGARSDPEHRCGIHVHVSGDGHTVGSLCNLVNIMASHEQLLISALNLDHDRVRDYARTVNVGFLQAVNQNKPRSLSELSTKWYECQGGLVGCSRHYHSSRYHMLNLHSFFTGKGLEFRLFQFDSYRADAPKGQRGGIHAGQLKAYVQLCLALSYRAKATRSASYKALETDNPRYAMRCWLLRLGFIGDDFATAREIFTRRLSGDCSFRHGRPKARPEATSPPPGKELPVVVASGTCTVNGVWQEPRPVTITLPDPDTINWMEEAARFAHLNCRHSFL